MWYYRSVENQHEEKFYEFLSKKEEYLINYNSLEYETKVQILNIWWNEKRKISIKRRSDYFKIESPFYKQISAILNSDDQSVTTKQIILEK
jgi:hypothetical protein